MRCLFVTHKWGDAAPGTGESVAIPHLIDTFVEWGKGELRTLWTDELHFAGEDINRTLQRAIADFEPTVTVFTPIPNPRQQAQNITPSQMRSCGSLVLSVFFDLAQTSARRLSEPYALASDLCVNVDGDRNPIGRQYLPLWPARVTRAPCLKTIDICFVGARKGYPDRIAALEAVSTAGINVTVMGGRDEQRCSFDEYMGTLDRSRIALNFSRTHAGDHQIKARIFEALSAHCCLVEDRNPATARYLSDGHDFLAWDDHNGLIALLGHLLCNPQEAGAVASQGNLTFRRQYSATIFWDRIAAALRLL